MRPDGRGRTVEAERSKPNGRGRTVEAERLRSNGPDPFSLDRLPLTVRPRLFGLDRLARIVWSGPFALDRLALTIHPRPFSLERCLKCTLLYCHGATCFRWHSLRLLDFGSKHALCLADEPIHFALLVPGPFVSRIAGAAALAVETVNAKKALLPGRRLEYSWADSGCSAQQGLTAMGELLGGASRVDAVIGPGCSSACEVTSYLVGGQRLAQLSWGCTASSLSDKGKHSLVMLSPACSPS